MTKDPYAWLEKSLTTIHRADWYRAVKTIAGRPGTKIILDGHKVINFASNDYLGLAGDERLIAAAIAATQEYGTGSTGSRLISGHRKLHRDLEIAIASLKETEDAVVFSSGYLANLSTITALVGTRDLILSDQYNHSSLKNGAKLSGANVIEYSHCNVTELKTHLVEQRQLYRRCLIITDSVFSMDGDLCPLPELFELATEFSCMLLLDEAHATGVLGERGSGCVEHFGYSGKNIIQVGTLSKALGSLGGYVAGSNLLIDFLRNRAPGWIYTTGLSPADTAAALTAIKILQQEPERRTNLWNNINFLKEIIVKQIISQQTSSKQIATSEQPNLKLLPSNSPIICFQLANSSTALKLGQQLIDKGIFAPAIRPPTVPTSRIRISVMATHELSQIQKLITILKNIL